MKRHYSFMDKQRMTKIVFVLLVALFTPAIANAYDYEVDGICYNLNQYTQTLEVTKNYKSKYSGHITIPATCVINGKSYPVTKIGYEAFANSDLTSVAMPNSIDTIGYYAFQNCKLESVEIPNSVKVIGRDAFNGCKMSTIVIPNSVERIDHGALDMSTLKTVFMGTGLKKIEFPWGFGFHSERQSIPDIKVFWLGNTPPTGYQDAFGKVNYVANDLYTSGYFRDSQVYTWRNKFPIITVYPFLSTMFTVDGIVYVPINPSERTCEAIDCTYDKNITEAHFGPTVTYKGIDMRVMGIHALTCFGNEYIKRVSFGDGIQEIGDRAFYGCTACEGVRIPKTIKKIGNEVFPECKSIRDFIFEDGDDVLELGFLIFNNCSLDSVYIGRNISYVPVYTGNGMYGATLTAHSPFYRNTSLRTVHITDMEDEIYENEFYGCSGLKNVRIGDGVKTIGNWAFSGCSSLDYFAFGSSMESIGEEAFSDCTDVTQIISRAAIPPTCGNQALDDINKWNCVLKVPKGSVDAYQAAPQWKEFFFIEAGVKDIQADTKVKRIHSLQGQSLSKPIKGLNIVEQENGTTKKVIIK